MKGLNNIESKENKCFLWYHIRHLSPLKTHPERITKTDKKMVNHLDYESKKQKIIFALMYFVMKIIWFIMFIYQIKNLKIIWIYC